MNWKDFVAEKLEEDRKRILAFDTSKELREFRELRNLTQEKAAEYFEILPGTYRDYEQGRSNPIPIIKAGIMEKIQADPVDEERLRKIARVWVAPEDPTDLEFDADIPSKGT